MRELAKKWGEAHGYKGEVGGWIYDPKGQHIAHGWGQFFFVFGHQIRTWSIEKGLIQEGQKL
jgi:hypothetical protein